MKHIAIDFREAVSPTRAGKGEYVFQLVSEMIKTIPDGVQLILVTRPDQNVDLPVGGWVQKRLSGRSWLWHLSLWWWLQTSQSVVAYFATTSAIVAAWPGRVPAILTVFDFTVWRYPKTHLSRAVQIEKAFLPTALKRSDHLLVISEFTKQEAIDLFGVPAHKMTVTPMAASRDFRPLDVSESDRQEMLSRYHLPDNFVLYLGTLEPRKNIANLVRAFDQIKSRFPDIKLVLAGGAGWQSENLVADAQSNPDVVVTGYIANSDRPTLYNLAKLFVFPSIYEGFGMPPLEAMQCGTPTVVSPAGPLPEVVGDAAYIADGTDHNALARALGIMLEDPVKRGDFMTRGLARAKHYSWLTTAQLTWEVLRRYG